MPIIFIILFILACYELSKWLDLMLGMRDEDISEVDLTFFDLILLIVSACYFVWFLLKYVNSFLV
jgi:hypothetical protein